MPRPCTDEWIKGISRTTVTGTPRPPARPSRGPEFQRIILETLLVAIAGGGLALVANALSPRGLSLTRNYFPGGGATSPGVPPVPITISNAGGATVSTQSTAGLAAQLRAKGLGLLEVREAARLFADPRYASEQLVFIDARDDRHYQEGHIPGAYQFDHYRPENYLPAVLPACQGAEQIVVYCTGGNCEDSEFAALTLRDAGIPAERLFIYAGGMTEWATNGLPVETGARQSGTLRTPKS
jgi:rhodanese-related sulfurtransferase